MRAVSFESYINKYNTCPNALSPLFTLKILKDK